MAARLIGGQLNPKTAQLTKCLTLLTRRPLMSSDAKSVPVKKSGLVIDSERVKTLPNGFKIIFSVGRIIPAKQVQQ